MQNSKCKVQNQRTNGPALAGELLSAGESAKVNVPIREGIDIEALKAGDANPVFVIGRAGKVGESRNKRFWSAAMLQKVIDALPLGALKGHVEEGSGRYPEYRDPVTHWLGGVLIGGELFVKGYVPPSQAALRDTIRVGLATGRAPSLSVWGDISGELRGKVFHVTDFKPERIDYGNPGDAGMPGSEVVATSGESRETTEETMDKAEILKALTAGELREARPDLVAAIAGETKAGELQAKEIAELKAEKTRLEGELKAEKDKAAADAKKMVGEHKTKLLENLPEAKREKAGEFLTGETVEALDKQYAALGELLGKDLPGLSVPAGAKKAGETKDDGPYEK